MKKLGVVLAIFAIVALIGCGSGTAGGSTKAAGGGGGAAPFKVDLSKLSAIVSKPTDQMENLLASGNFQTQPELRNKNAFTKNWEDFYIILPPDALPKDMSKYTRLTLTCKFFDKSGAPLEPADSMVQVVFIYDPKGDLRGPAMDAGPNTPVKAQNVMGFSGMINKDRGIRVTFKQPPQGILFQKAQDQTIGFVELTSVVFHNGDYKSE